MVAVLARHGDRPSQRRGAVLHVAERDRRDAERVQRRRLVAPATVAGKAGELVERLLGDVHRGAVLRLHHQPLRALREQGRALGARAVVGEQRERPLHRVPRLVLAHHHPLRAREEPVEGGGAARGRRSSTAARARRTSASARGTSSLRRWHEAARSSTLASSSPGERLGIRHAAPQLQHAPEQLGALLVGLHVHGRDARPHGRGERGGLVARGEVVVGDPGRALRGRGRARGQGLLQRRGERTVELGALPGQQLVVDRLAQQRVAERVAVARARDDDVARDGLAQRVVQRPRRRGRPHAPAPRARRPRRRTARARPPARRARAARSARRARPPGWPGAPRARPGRRRAAPPCRAGCPRCARTGGRRGRPPPSPIRSASCSASSSRASRGELDAQRTLRALELGEQRAERMAAMQLVRAVGGDHEASPSSATRAARKRRNARVDASAQCRSSIDEQHGRGARRARPARRAAPRRRAPGRRGGPRGGAPPRARAAARQLGLHRRRERLQHRVAVAGERAHRRDERGVGAAAPSPSSTQSPLSTRAPYSPARCWSSRTRRVFPTPGLPGDEGERGPPVGGLAIRTRKSSKCPRRSATYCFPRRGA